MLAISRVLLGAHDMDGTHNEDAWKKKGYDLDSTISEDQEHATCAAVDVEVLPETFVDGDAGRDNSFGKNVLPMLELLEKEVEARTNDDLKHGRYTTLFDLRGLGAAPEYLSLTAEVYEGAQLMGTSGAAAAPRLDGSDVWPIAFESVRGGAPAGSLAPITGAYVAGGGCCGTWVGRSAGVLVLHLATSNEPERDRLLGLRLHDPLITLQFSRGRLRATGTLAGTLHPEELVPEVRRVLALQLPSYCSMSQPDILSRQLAAATDLLQSGAIQPEVDCDAISFGIELEAVRVKLGPIAPPAAPPMDPCAL